MPAPSASRLVVAGALVGIACICIAQTPAVPASATGSAGTAATNAPATHNGPRAGGPNARGPADAAVLAQDNPSGQQQRERQERLHKQLQQEASQLVDLAQQLKLAVDQNNPNVLSLDVVHRANDIDKLARKIRDSMKSGTY